MALYYIPIVLTIVGLVSLIFPPKNINYLYGYRTKRAMKNTETWKEAQLYSGKLFTIFGPLIMLLTYLLLDLYNPKTATIVNLTGLLFIMILTIVLTEIRLYKIIKNGNNEDT